MIEINDFTIIDNEPYTCIKIEEGIAYMKKVSETRGRYMQMAAHMVPYFKDGDLIIPEKPKREKSITGLKIPIAKLLREETNMPVSRNLVKFVHEHITDLVTELAWCAKENAEEYGDKTLKPSHWYFLQIPPDAGYGYWAENNEYMG
tara:strand:+ start:2743 stop:3183 length:441 start_codon:yes stop_codon:yes gene_type:complete